MRKLNELVVELFISIVFGFSYLKLDVESFESFHKSRQIHATCKQVRAEHHCPDELRRAVQSTLLTRVLVGVDSSDPASWNPYFGPLKLVPVFPSVTQVI